MYFRKFLRNSAVITFMVELLDVVFTAPRVCIARTMPWRDICLSVRPSVCHTPVLSLNGYTYPQLFFNIE